MAEQGLDSVAALERARQLLADAQRVVTFSGAGLSAGSGVPTFRDAQDADALWAKHDPMQLASPQGFAADPQLVSDWYDWRRRAIAQASPNAAHIALAAQRHMTHITQNVDDLLERAGAREVIHLHGTIGYDRCNGRTCDAVEAVELARPPGLRRCSSCGEYLRPAVVWFGEALPAEAWHEAERACRDCDVMVVIGTSAAVYPAAGLITTARAAGARVVVVNTQPSGASAHADVELIGPAAEVVPPLLATHG